MSEPAAAPRVIGHRGAAAHAPENTLAGFRVAAELGTSWVEFDVQATRDDCAFLLHDARLERTTDGFGIAVDRSAAEIARLDAGRWFAPRFRGEAVPRLDAALALLAELGLGAIVEVKSEPGDGARTMRAALAMLRGAAPCDTLVLSSFEEDALAVAAAQMPEIPRALIVKTIPADWQERIERLGCTALHVGERGLVPAMIAEVAQLCPVRAFTVNAPGRARDLFGWGAAAVFTDCPDVIMAEIGQGPRVARRWGST